MSEKDASRNNHRIISKKGAGDLHTLKDIRPVREEGHGEGLEDILLVFCRYLSHRGSSCGIATATLSPVLIHFQISSSFLSLKLQQGQHCESNPFLPPIANRHPGPAKPRYEIPAEQWPMVLRRVVENQEPLRNVADDYRVSHETIRRLILASQKQPKTS